jgi:hypothetical protein
MDKLGERTEACWTAGTNGPQRSEWPGQERRDMDSRDHVSDALKLLLYKRTKTTNTSQLKIDKVKGKRAAVKGRTVTCFWSLSPGPPALPVSR